MMHACMHSFMILYVPAKHASNQRSPYLPILINTISIYSLKTWSRYLPILIKQLQDYIYIWWDPNRISNQSENLDIAYQNHTYIWEDGTRTGSRVACPIFLDANSSKYWSHDIYLLHLLRHSISLLIVLTSLDSGTIDRSNFAKETLMLSTKNINMKTAWSYILYIIKLEHT